MFKIGLKLWSTNRQYIKDAIALYERGLYDYIELFSVPGSYDEYIKDWEALGIPYVIHAPHFYQGMCLSLKEKFHDNMRLAFEALKFADTLKAPWVVFHSGVNGSIYEVARQLKIISDSRVLIENKPYAGLAGEVCNGSTPQDIAYLKAEAGVGFCLDIGHAICAANSFSRNHQEYLKEMLTLKPQMFHMTDGDANGMLDQHLHFGEGSYDFEMIAQLLPTNASISIECQHTYQDSLNDFEADSLFVKNMIKNRIKNSLVFSKANWKDVNRLFDLANDLDVRRNAFIQEQIPFSSHLKWFETRVDDEKTLLLTIFDERAFVGAVRFDLQSGLVNECLMPAKISIWLGKEYRGLGIGTTVLEKGLALARNHGIKIVSANIFDDNAPSKKLFSNVGFKVEKIERVNGRLFGYYLKDLLA